MDGVISKPFAWSYSKLHGFEICPRRYHETDLKKAWPEERSAQLAWGDAVHEAMAEALKTGTALPTVFKIFQPWIDRIKRTKGELLVEEDCKWACTREFKPTPWFAKNVWMRAIADVVKINDDAALVVDWKAGKSLNVDSLQMTIVSLMMFVHFPQLQVVRSDFIWLNEDDHTTQVLYRNEAADQWAQILPRVKLLEQATADENFPPKPNRFCAKWCAVRTCEYWGK